MNYGKNATMLHLRKYDSKKTKLLNKTKIIITHRDISLIEARTIMLGD